MGVLCSGGSFSEGDELGSALSRGSCDIRRVGEVGGGDGSEKVVPGWLEFSGRVRVRNAECAQGCKQTWHPRPPRVAACGPGLTPTVLRGCLFTTIEGWLR